MFFPALTYTYIYIYLLFFYCFFSKQKLTDLLPAVVCCRNNSSGGPPCKAMACSLGRTTMYCTIHAVESLREEEAETTWTAAGRQADFISWEFLGLIYLYFLRGMLRGGRSCVSFLWFEPLKKAHFKIHPTVIEYDQCRWSWHHDIWRQRLSDNELLHLLNGLLLLS